MFIRNKSNTSTMCVRWNFSIKCKEKRLTIKEVRSISQFLLKNTLIKTIAIYQKNVSLTIQTELNLTHYDHIPLASSAYLHARYIQQNVSEYNQKVVNQQLSLHYPERQKKHHYLISCAGSRAFPGKRVTAAGHDQLFLFE